VLPTQNFAEAHTIQTGMSVGGVPLEGILGLGSIFGNTTTGAGNLVTNLHSRGLIARNLFSLILPYRTPDDVGVLILDDTSLDTELEDVKMIPVTDKKDDGGWWGEIGVMTNAW
jgi:Eukaryotic aspartyl protease